MNNLWNNVLVESSVANMNTRDKAIKMGKKAHNVGVSRKPQKDSDFRKLSKGLTGKPLNYLEKGWLDGWDSIKGAVIENFSDEVKSKLLKKFGDDPFYKKVIDAKNSKEGQLALKALGNMRGPIAVKQFIDYGKKLVKGKF